MDKGLSWLNGERVERCGGSTKVVGHVDLYVSNWGIER